MDFLVAEKTVGYGPCLGFDGTSPRHLNLVPLMHQIPVQPMRLRILVWLAMCVLAGCQTAQQRKAAENATVNKEAGDEIARICALHGAEREMELKKLKAASGLDLYCPTE